MVFFCTSTSLGLWLPAALLSDEVLSNGSVDHASVISGLTISYAVLMGIASGSNISLAPVCVSRLCDTRQYGEYYGMCYTIVAFGTLTGVPIAGAIIGENRAYWAGALFCGLCYLCALVAFMAIRIAQAGWKWTARY
jgi:predicted MFS family arabinose efflux permease